MPQNKNNSKIISTENTYFSEIKGFRDLRATDKISRSIGIVFGFLGMIVACISCIGMIYIGSKSKFIPVVYIADSHGGLTYAGIATDTLKITNPMIANQLADYVVNLRQIPQDIDLKSQYMRKIKMMSTQDLFVNIITPMIKERYMANIGKTVKISIRNVIPIGKNSWQLDWDEMVGDMPPNRYKGTITFTLDQHITDPAVLLYDPLGMVINDININQEIN